MKCIKPRLIIAQCMLNKPLIPEIRWPLRRNILCLFNNFLVTTNPILYYRSCDRISQIEKHHTAVDVPICRGGSRVNDNSGAGVLNSRYSLIAKSKFTIKASASR